MLASNESCGDLGAHRLLFPNPLSQLVPAPWPAQFTVAGDLLTDNMRLLPELVSLGVDHFDATYDADLHLLTSWTAVINGEPAARRALSRLTAV